MSIDRRQFIEASALGGAAAVVPALPALANQAAGATARSAGVKNSAAFRTLLDNFGDRALALSPMSASLIGVDTGKRAGLRSQLDDPSEAGREKSLAAAAAMKKDLAAVRPETLSGQDRTLYDAVAYALDLTDRSRQWKFGNNGFGPLSPAATPYVLTQQNGAYSGVPDFLDNYHKIETKADADAYLARLSRFGPTLDAETERFRADVAKRVIPPLFILDTTESQLKEMRATPVAQQTVVTSLARRAAERKIPGDWEGRARSIVEKQVMPALDRQIAAVGAARSAPRADNVAGVYKLPEGAEYYEWALKAATTTDVDYRSIHDTGLLQLQLIQEQADKILRAQGMTQGTVGERLSALTRDPKQLYPNTDAGRAEVLAYVQTALDRLRAIIPRVSNLGLKVPVDVKRVAPAIEAGAALGYMNFASRDGSRPAIYYINLRDTANWPRYTLTTLSAHEGIPGHAFQGAYLSERSAEAPLISSLMGFNAFVEGWALYAEQLADEAGVYADDPLGRLGMLQAFAFRATRLVVDTGIHARQWTRDQAIEFMETNTGRSRAAVTSEIDRYCASPAQACGYKVGHNYITELRDTTQSKLGAKFDLRRFNDAIVTTGGVPLDVLGPAVDRYMASA